MRSASFARSMNQKSSLFELSKTDPGRCNVRLRPKIGYKKKSTTSERAVKSRVSTRSTECLFTGIVQGTAKCSEISSVEASDDRIMKVSFEFPSRALLGVKIGCSIAINGTCLTVVEFDENESRARFDCVEETLRATNLGQLKVNDVVNFERSARVGDEIGGHVVSGHVHTVAEIYEQRETENNREVRFRVRDRAIAKYVLPKGFVAIDGCSLTVGDVCEEEGTFSVWLIPETIRATAFKQKGKGSSVNVEIESSTRAIVDTIERYMEKQKR